MHITATSYYYIVRSSLIVFEALLDALGALSQLEIQQKAAMCFNGTCQSQAMSTAWARGKKQSQRSMSAANHGPKRSPEPLNQGSGGV